MAVVRKNAATKIAKIKSDFMDKGLTELASQIRTVA
jgi:hypothetical protein